MSQLDISSSSVNDSEYPALPLLLLWLDKFVNGDVSIVLSFIDMQELMFVNVYMSYKYRNAVLP